VIRRLLSAWERVSLYLPILLMGLLALLTYWLVRSAPVFEASAPEKPATHEPDYFARQFSLKSFDANGRLRSEIIGAEARHYRDTDNLEIDRVQIRSFDNKGQLTEATALRAITNSDASQVQLIGNAHVVRAAVADKPRLSLKSEFLHADLDTERVRTDKPVELVRGDDRFTANSMDFDNIDQVVRLDGRVRGTLAPRRGP